MMEKGAGFGRACRLKKMSLNLDKARGGVKRRLQDQWYFDLHRGQA
jgi:hypothetical protein